MDSWIGGIISGFFYGLWVFIRDWVLMVMPWYGWIILIGGALALTVPWWLPVWTRLPGWAKFLLGGAAIGFVANMAGRQQNAALRDEKDKQRDARTAAARDAGVKAVKQLSNAELQKRANRWVEDDVEEPVKAPPAKKAKAKR